MHMLDALRATIGTRKLARPTAGLRPGLGYYVQGTYVWLHDPTALAAAAPRGDAAVGAGCGRVGDC